MIKTFENIKSAYSGSCRICNTPIQESLSNQFDWENEHRDFIKLNLPDNDLIIFDQNTGTITDFSITETANTRKCMTFGMSPLNFVGPPHIKYSIYDGVLAVGHNISCTNCHMYDYTLQLFVNLDYWKVTKAILNSEFVTIDEGEHVYEIKNVYTLEKTEYTHIAQGIHGKTLILPLVSNSMKRPKDVLKRVKSLLLFS